MLARSLVAVVVVVGLLVTLPGCTSAEYKQQRLENLNAAIEEFDAASVGEVLCEAHGGEVALGRGYTHSYLFGADSWEPIVARFAQLNYSGSDTSPHLSYSRSDGIIASGKLYDEQPSTDSEVAEELEAIGCDLPSSAFIYMQFSERGVSS